jgi:hypothetical protein
MQLEFYVTWNKLIETSSMRAPPQSKLRTHFKAVKSALCVNVFCLHLQAQFLGYRGKISVVRIAGIT